MTFKFLALPVMGLALSACAGAQMPDVTRLIEPSVIRASSMTPPSSKPGECWGHEAGQQVTKIVNQTVLVEPATYGSDGKETSPAIYRRVDAPKVINEGDGRWFQRVCTAQVTPELIATLQRALAARGLYQGKDSGVMDMQTRRAVQAYQKAQGLDSPILSLSAAQQLGLVEIALSPEISDGN